MKTKWWVVTVFFLGLLTGRIMSSTALAQFRTGQVTRLLTTDLSSWCAGKEVTVELGELGAGTSGKHYHPGHSFSYVLEGSETYTIEGQAPKVVRAGDVLHEEPMQVHTVENSAPVKLLVVRIVDKGKETMVRVP
jgi:quercetin dioxygenase-like cupin family protein